MSSSAKNSAISLNGVAAVMASLLVGISASAVQTPAVSERIASLGKAPLYFEATRSSDNESFVARGQDCDVVLEPTVAVLSIGEHSAASSFPSKAAVENQSAAIRTVRLVLEGANTSAMMSGLESLPGKVNYLLGSDSAQWRTGVPLFARVKVAEVYPGIDLVYYADQSARLEYDFVLQSSASPDQISFRIEGADKVSVDARGDLVLKIGSQEIRQHRPVIYQNVNGRRQPVEGRYALTDRNTVGFRVGHYDRNRQLVIDPVVDFSTFLGGSKTENGWAIAVDAAGNIYVAGETLSKNLPTTPGAYTNHYAGGIRLFGDAFVAKYGAVSNELVYLTYLGGKTDDGALGLAVDAAGSAYVTGFTDSKNFPIVPDSGVIRSNLTGRNNNAFKLFAVDAFVTQLSP
ncbi:MAG: SBBP repeat-containing protein, partial [Verrucomicrobiota bacterium]